MQTSLLGIAKKARSEKQYRFRNLYRMINEEMLYSCWREPKERRLWRGPGER